MNSPNEQFSEGPPKTPCVPVAHLVYTFEHVSEANRRVLKAQGKRFRLSMTWMAVLAILAVVALMQSNGRRLDEWHMMGLIFLVLVLLVFGKIVFGKALEWVALRRFRNSEFLDLELTAEFTDNGVHFCTRDQDSLLKWTYFNNVAHFGDGSLLFDRDSAYWFPKTAFGDVTQWRYARVILDENLPHVNVEPPE